MASVYCGGVLFVFKLLFQLAGSMLTDVSSQLLHISDGPELL